MLGFEKVSVVCPSAGLTSSLKASVKMNLSTHATGSSFEVRWIEDAECFENDMVEHNSWTYSGTSMNTSAGCWANLADNWMKYCSKLDIGVEHVG